MTENNTEHNTKHKTHPVVIGLLSIFIILTLFFGYRAMTTTGAAVSTLGKQGPDVIPKGIPDVYGKELGVSFDDISPNDQSKADSTIRTLGVLDTQIQLTGDLLQRYIDAVSQISCEYCCGAKSIIFESSTGKYKAGDSACGCAHSYAMRGLAKYLLKNHADEFSNDQILEELGKWKTLFFPEQITQKAQILKERGIKLNYINLASNKYRGIESSSSGSGMVGGC